MDQNKEEEVKKDDKDKELEEYQKLADELWFSGGSCTGGKVERISKD